MGDFDIDTRVEGSGGRYRANISREWEIWGPNGGYVAAIALRAAGRGWGWQSPAGSRRRTAAASAPRAPPAWALR